LTHAAASGGNTPFASDGRLAAGAPPADDVFKCALTPLDMADDKPAMTAQRLAQLKEALLESVQEARLARRAGTFTQGARRSPHWAKPMTGAGSFMRRNLPWQGRVASVDTGRRAKSFPASQRTGFTHERP
jgi:Tannase-like family of unknown function (DUF6351)